jgi:probable phosphoglycerate mutase
MVRVPIPTPEIHFVRHGHHPEGFRGGWSQHPLSRLGVIQSSLLAERLRREGTQVDTLISSDLPRAEETAEILSATLNVGVTPAREWREVDNGVLAGMPEDQAKATYPGLYWSSLEMDQPYPGGESPAAFHSRIEEAFRSLCDRLSRGEIGPRVMVVTHGGPMRVVLSLVEGTPWSNRQPAVTVQETGMFSLTWTGKAWSLTRTNDVTHLAGLDVRSLPASVGTETETVVHPLVTGDIEQFMQWRATDDHLANWALKEIGEHLDGKRILLVAEANDQLVGTFQFVPNHEDKDLADGRLTAYLQALEIREGFRRRGLGTWLITSVERLAVERGFQRLTLMVEPDNGPALSLYQKLGFSFFKDFTEIWRGKPHYLLCMEKSLTAR